MKRNSLKVLSTLGMLGLVGVALVSCGKKEDPSKTTPADTSNKEQVFDPSQLIAGFDKNLSGTVKLTYNANYNVDVNSNGGTGNMDSFKHQIRSTTTVEMDLGSDLYIKTSKEAKDLLKGDTVTKTEELLYKSGDKYYYETSSTASVEVAANEASAKVNEILGNVTLEQAGKIDLGALLYNKTDKQYEFDYLSFSTSVSADDVFEDDSIVYSKGSNGGLKVEAKPYYVGYKTDGGYSDFYNKADGYAATLNLETNNKGQVTSWKEVYNKAALDFAIMSVPPTVTITGERGFTASYGEAITKASSLKRVASTASYKDATGGTYVVKTCASGDFQHMTDVANGGSLELGKVICVKATPAEGKVIDKITVNGSTETLIDPEKAGGWYYFNVAVGENKIDVTFKDSAAPDTPAAPTLKFKYNGTHSNGTVMDINLYDDNTYTITCPAFGNAVAVKGTYTMKNGVLTLSAKAEDIKYIQNANRTSVEFTVSADFQTLNTNAFFDSTTLSFAFVKNN